MNKIITSHMQIVWPIIGVTGVSKEYILHTLTMLLHCYWTHDGFYIV